MQVKLNGITVNTNGTLPLIGKTIPDFILVNQDLKNISLKDFKGKRKLISLVPSLDTDVCSTSAKKFNQAMKDHPEVLALVISADLPFAQKRVCGIEKLDNIVLLSMMRSKDFAKNYGMLLVEGPLAGLCARAVLVVDEEDKVIYQEVVPEITEEPNYNACLDKLFNL